MSKGETTKSMILEKTARFLSLHGYFGSSLSDIMRETGLEKGGIYNHFASKDELALEAFDYAYELVQRRVRLALNGKKHAVERLHALLGYFESLLDDPLLPGGCPLLNTATEADDAHPALRERALHAMDQLRATFVNIITRGIERHEIRPTSDAEACASIFIATLEGAVMLSKLYQDVAHMRRAVAHLARYIETELRWHEEAC